MSQHDFDIANQGSSSARADINNALKALASLSSGATAPSTTYANMLWYDTGTNILKVRAEADDAWISIGYLDQSTDAFSLFDDTRVVNSGGTQTGILGDQSTSIWEAGTGNTESLVSPAKVKAAIDALVTTSNEIGDGQTWASVSRTSNTSYQNTEGRSIQVNCILGITVGNSGSPDFQPTYTGSTFQVSDDNSTWITVADTGSFPKNSDSGFGEITDSVFAVIPDNHYYKFTGVYKEFNILS